MEHLLPQRMRILIVDDNPVNVMVLERTLAAAGYSNIRSTGNPAAVVLLCHDEPPDLILLDLHMPELTGFQVMAALAKLAPTGPAAPILVVTADNTAEVRKRALSYGAIDFVTSPFDRGELELRVRNHLRARRLALELAVLAGDHEERSRLAQDTLDEARMEVLERLAGAAEFRDGENPLHTWRVGRLAGMIAGTLSLPADSCAQLAVGARLHDVGKIAIPDEILSKTGSLDPAEWEAVHRHCTLGAQILAGNASPLMARAQLIARSHHERWDGGGYPEGLRDTQIPQVARIVAIADAFDVVTHPRAYGEAWTDERARAHLSEQRGRQFDPEMVDAFLALDPRGYAGSSPVRAAMVSA